MGFFDIDWDKLTREYIPEELRYPIRYRWLRVLVSGVRDLYAKFMIYRAEVLYFLDHNSQVCRLEGLLNDAFDRTDRRIYISDTVYPEVLPVYVAAENKPVIIYLSDEAAGPYLYTGVEIAVADAADVFVVNVPTAATLVPGYSEARLRALVNKYRLPSMGAYAVSVF